MPEITYDIKIRMWVVYAVMPINAVRYLLGKEMWLPSLAIKMGVL